MDIKKVVVGASCALAVSFANATPTYVAPVGTDGAGTGLQDMLDSRTQDGDFDLDVQSDQQQPDETWTIDAAARANTIMMFEIAGNANQNVMGIYDLNDTSNRLSLFDGTASNGYSSSLAINNVGNFVVTQFDDSGLVSSQSTSSFSNFSFGFYLTSPNHTFFSQSALNNDYDGDGLADDHMIALQGTGTDKVDTLGTSQFYGTFTSNNYILAWEDLRFDAGGIDYDYNDMVVMIESFLPVPEPGTLALLGLGLAGLGAARRRQKA